MGSEMCIRDSYEASTTGKCMTKRMLMPQKGQQQIDYDEVSAYGYRSPHPDLFFYRLGSSSSGTRYIVFASRVKTIFGANGRRKAA